MTARPFHGPPGHEIMPCGEAPPPTLADGTVM
jgi:hypothetical protein